MAENSGKKLFRLGSILLLFAALAAIGAVAAGLFTMSASLRSGFPDGDVMRWATWGMRAGLVGALALSLGGIWLRRLGSRYGEQAAFPVVKE